MQGTVPPYGKVSHNAHRGTDCLFWGMSRGGGGVQKPPRSPEMKNRSRLLKPHSPEKPANKRKHDLPKKVFSKQAILKFFRGQLEPQKINQLIYKVVIQEKLYRGSCSDDSARKALHDKLTRQKIDAILSHLEDKLEKGEASDKDAFNSDAVKLRLRFYSWGQDYEIRLLFVHLINSLYETSSQRNLALPRG